MSVRPFTCWQVRCDQCHAKLTSPAGDTVASLDSGAAAKQAAAAGWQHSAWKGHTCPDCLAARLEAEKYT